MKVSTEFENILSTNMAAIKKQCRTHAYKFRLVYGDVLGDTLEKMWRYQKNFKFEDGDTGFRKWVMFVSYSVCVDIYRVSMRTKNKGTEVELDWYGELASRLKQPTSNYATTQYFEFYMTLAREKFTERDFKVLELAIMNYKMEEISEIMEMDPGTVRSSLHRVRHKMSEIREKIEGEKQLQEA